MKINKKFAEHLWKTHNYFSENFLIIVKKYDMAQDEIFEKLFNEMIDEAARQMSEQDHEDISPAEVHFSPEHEKKMSLKKLMAVGLSAMLSLSVFAAVPAFAEPTENMPKELRDVVPFNIVITKTQSYLSISSGQTLRCHAETSVASGNNAGLTMELQQKQNGKQKAVDASSLCDPRFFST